jgi:hypothetical protein
MSQSENVRPDEPIVAAAEQVLTRAFGFSIRLGAAQTQGSSDRSNVLRCAVLEAGGAMPSSVILKRAQSRPEHPYDPESGESGSPAWRLFNDWAGAEFLSGVSGDPPLCPRFYGGDRAVGLIVLEDLGEGDSLADLLLGRDPRRAEQGLLAFAGTLGRMHAATIGHGEEFARLRQQLGPSAPNDRTAQAEQAREGFQNLQSGCEALGIVVPRAATVEAEMVAATMQDPGPFLAYTHGDPCPDNDRLDDGHLRLFDFEFGGFRHALLDGVYGRAPFPTCWCVNRLPSHLPAAMEAAYRAELIQGCPQASNEALFASAVVAACTYWMLVTLSWHLSDAREKDDEWGISTIRQRILTRLDSFAATADEFRSFPSLSAVSRALAAKLRSVWPPEADAMPLYPAFR